jgi:minichromosome maintenance protein 10
MLDRGSPSPTPRKRPQPETNDDLASLPLPSDGDEEEDEEMLQLKLQAIEARMKLKKLQAKNKRTGGSEAQDSKSTKSSRPRTAIGSTKERPRPTASSNLQPPIQVPVSPVKDRRTRPEQKSPARVVLGIDKGLRASDISLKRAASASGTSSRYDLMRHVSTPGILEKNPKPKSFSERIAESRVNEREVQEKEERIKKARSTGFGVAKADLAATRGGQAQAPKVRNDEQRHFSTKQSAVFGGRRPPVFRMEPTDSTSPEPRKSTSVASYSETERNRRSASPSPSLPLTPQAGAHSEPTQQTSADDESDSGTTLEPYSGLYLSKRLISHDTLTRTFQGRELYSLPRLLKEVTSPHYDPPSCESDYVVLGILASKSAPRNQKPSAVSISTSGDAEDKARPKFMVLRLTDFKWSIDVFLFDTGFERFWKLIPGTVVGLLNPGIMPPRNKDKGDFSLKLTSCDDTVLEIGRSRDLGFCKAKKKDGSECGDWIDKRKTTVCEFHIALQVEKTKRGRMEINGMAGLYGASGSREGSSRGKGRDELKREGRYHDQHLHETMWIAPKEFSRNSASLIDGHDDYNAYERGMSREELLRKKKKGREKEKALAEKLSLKGHGAGSEYLKAERLDKPTSTDPTAPSAYNTQELVDAKALGLLSNKAGDVRLSPVKGRKKASAFIQEPMGWKGAFKRGLPSPTRDARREKNDKSPSPKKARFMLENKGIREPGRESFGNVTNDVVLDDDDDDGLDIIP